MTSRTIFESISFSYWSKSLPSLDIFSLCWGYISSLKSRYSSFSTSKTSLFLLSVFFTMAFPDTTGAFVLIAQPGSDSLTDSLAKVSILDAGLVDAIGP